VFCDNNPVNFMDPSGLDSSWWMDVWEQWVDYMTSDPDDHPAKLWEYAADIVKEEEKKKRDEEKCEE